MKRMFSGLVVGALCLFFLSCESPTTKTPADQVVTLLAIPGVVAPVCGAVPVVAAIDTSQYTGTISWSPSDSPFAASTVYSATVTLTPKTGWTLAGVAGNSLTVAGASATNAVNSGTAVATFPATEGEATQTDDVITLLAISGVVTPVRGAVPSAAAIDTAQYTGTIDWSPADSPFAASTVYSATIALTPKTGWTLVGVASNSFTVAGASAANGVNSGTIVAKFPATAAKPAVLTDYASTNIGTLKAVPAGSFQRDAGTANVSTISTAFRMSEKEITRAQFLAIMNADPSDTTHSTGTSDPVEKVNWYRAVAFCNKLSIAEGLTPVYAVTDVDFATLTYDEVPTAADAAWDATTVNWTNNGYRLPTEAEWMWAAMGADAGQPGVTNTTGYNKSFAGSSGANAIGDYVWYGLNSLTNKTSPAGTKTANEMGLFDMSGNVWEWCWDWSAEYSAGTLTDSSGPTSGTYRVVRGGDWRNLASYATVAFRADGDPYATTDTRGFRVVRR